MKKQKLFIPAVALGMLLPACGGDPVSPSSNPSSSNPSDPSSSQTVSDSGYVSTESVSSSISDKSSSSASEVSSKTSSASSDDLGEGVYAGNLRIWYHRDDMRYDSLRIYLWNSAVDGIEYEWSGEDEEYGVYYETNLSENPQFALYPSTDIRLIIKYAGSWGGQSLDTICVFDDFEKTLEDGQEWLNIYLAAGEGSAVDQFAKRQDALGDHFDACYVGEDWKTVYITGVGTKGERTDEQVGAIASYELYGFDRNYYSLRPSQRPALENYLIKNAVIKQGEFHNKLTITLDEDVDPTIQYEVRGYFVSDTTKLKTKAISMRRLFDTDKFARDYSYDGDDLGSTVNPDGTVTFKVWAPTSSNVKIRGYLTGTPWNLVGRKVKDLSADFPMEYEGRGVWSLTWNKSYQWYTYVAINANGAVEAADPYSKATGLNGERSAILNWNDAAVVDPEGWNDGAYVDEKLTPISSSNNITAYEVHIRDLTADKTWTSNKGNRRGTFNAFCEEGTTYTQANKSVSTGFDHIKSLGVNAIQLLPVFDSDNDERVETNYDSVEGSGELNPAGYNWGYNPLNYNCVEGVYSSDPTDPKAAITEYKHLIQVAADNDIRVIMDVVYNHMSSVANNSFTKLVPFYFFRSDAAGNYTDGSGCGNEVATQRPMASKFIVDSVKWWASEYRVKGFRFDLMGVIDLDTMKAVRKAVNEVDPTIVLYGEGWTGGGSALEGGKQATTNNVYYNLNTSEGFPVGCFNDAGRDGAKGNTQWADVTPAGGWINEGSNVENVYNTLTQILGQNRWAKQALGDSAFDMNPNQTVNYLACHDNYTLYDQINYLFYKHNGTFGDVNHEDVMKAATSLSALSLMGQGIGFVHGGDEFFRSKIIEKGDYWFDELVASYKHATNGKDSWIEGDGVKIDDNRWLVRNSYKYGDAVNSFKWDRLLNDKVAPNFAKFKDAIKLRIAQMGKTLGQNLTQIYDEGTTCWSYNDLFDGQGKSKTDLLAGFFKDQSDNATHYIFTNKGNGAASISIGDCDLEVLYSSTGDHAVGEVIKCTGSVTAAKFETLFVKKVA